jgi:hypothetical protein
MSFLLINAIDFRLAGIHFNCQDISSASACSGQGATPLYVDLPDTGKLADEYS